MTSNFCSVQLGASGGLPASGKIYSNRVELQKRPVSESISRFAPGKDIILDALPFGSQVIEAFCIFSAFYYRSYISWVSIELLKGLALAWPSASPSAPQVGLAVKEILKGLPTNRDTSPRDFLRTSRCFTR